jgi:hypothetical protein
MKYYIIILLLLTSCATQRRCFEKWGMKPDTVRTVIVKDSLVVRDTTIFVKIPGMVVRDSVIIPCPPPPPAYIPDTAKVETDFAIAKAWWNYPVIRLYLEQKDKLLRLQLDSAIRDSWHWRTEYLNVTQVLKEKYVPKIYKQALSICIFIFIAGGAFIGIKIYRLLK